MRCKLLTVAVLAAACTILLGAAATQAPAATYSWVPSSGDWATSSNWGGIPPGTADTALIDNGGTATVSQPTAACGTLSLGDSRGSGTVGITTGSLTASLAEDVGYFGVGTITQWGGTNSVNNFGNLYLGYNTSSSGAYNLSGSGLLSPQGNAIVGWSGTGTFTQLAGTDSPGNYLYLGYNGGARGSYNLGSGLLSPGSDEYVGRSGTGTFAQSGGTNSIASGNLWLGGNATATGVYSLSGSGLLSASQYEYLGVVGTGTVTQSAGTNTVGSGLYFGYNGGSGTYNLNGGLLVVSQISLGSGSGQFNLGGGTIAASGLMSVTMPLTLTGSDGAGTINNGGYLVTLSGPLSGPGGLVATGTGTLVLSGSNGCGGPTTIGGGTLQLGAGGGAGSLSTSSAITDNATLAFSRSNTVTQGVDFSAAAITGTGALVQMGPGTLLLGASNGYSGGTTIVGGVLQIGNSAALGSASGSLTFSAGTLDVHGYNLNVGALSGGETIDNLSGSGSLTVGNGGATSTFSGTIQNTAGQLSVTKTGTGTLVLAANNGYTGGTTIDQGILETGSNLALGSSMAPLGVAAGGTLDVHGYNLNVGALNGSGIVDNFSISDSGSLAVGNGNASGIFVGTIQNTMGQLAVTKSGTGTLVLTAGNNYSGGTTIAGGVLQVGNSAALGSASGSLTVSGGTLDMHGYDLNVGVLSGSGIVDNLSGSGSLTAGNGGATSTFSGTIRNTVGQLSFSKVGSGALTWTGQALVGGNIAVDGGSIQMPGGSLLINGDFTTSSAFVQTGGTVGFGTGSSGSWPAFTVGYGNYSLSGTGLISALSNANGSMFVGGGGSAASFSQTGGTVSLPSFGAYVGEGNTGSCSVAGSGVLNLSGLLVGNNFGSGTFTLGQSGQVILSGSQAGFGGLSIGGYWSSGTLTQSAGTVSVVGATYGGLVLGWNQGQGSYVLGGGLLNTAASPSGEFLGQPGIYSAITGSDNGTGLLQQTGGTNSTTYVFVGSGGRYQFSGGILQLNSPGGLQVTSGGTLDGGNAATALNVPANSILDLTGTLVNTGSMNVSVATNSIVIVPPGFNPAATFHSFSNLGLTHTLGTTLTIAPNQSLSFPGLICDPVVVRGSLTDPAGDMNGLWLAGGLTLSGTGSVSVGSYGGVVTDSSTSSMTGGTLSGGGRYVGLVPMGTGAFIQSGGVNTCSNFCIGYDYASNGTYFLSGTGQVVSIGNGESVGFSGSGAFVQSGGTNSVSSYWLALGSESGGYGTYNLSAGLLSANSEILGESGTGAFTQSGGSNSSALVLGFWSGAYGTYNLNGGLLSGNSQGQTLGASGTGAFTQSGGTNSCPSDLVLGLWSGGYGAYNLNGGLLITWGVICVGSGSGQFNLGGGTIAASGPVSVTMPLTLTGSGGAGTISNGGYTVTLSSLISGPGGLVSTGSGTLVLAASNNYTGGTSINQGVLQLANANGAQDTTVIVNANNGLQFASGIGSFALGGLSGAGALALSDTGGAAVALTVGGDGDSTTYSGGIGGAGSLTKDGSGTLTLGGSNSFTGGTTINTGAIIFSASSAVAGAPASITANAGAVAAAGYPIDQSFLNRLAASSSGVAALAANSSNNLSMSGFSALRLGAVGNATYSGTLTPSGTTYRFGGGGGILTIVSPLSGANAADVGSNGTPPATVVLAGSNTYTGATQVSGGTLVLVGDNLSSSFTANNGGTLEFNAAAVNLGTGCVRANAGGSVQYLNAAINGGYLRGPGTHVILPGTASTFSGVTTYASTNLQQNGPANFTDFTNGGQVANNAPLAWDGGTNILGGNLAVNNTLSTDDFTNAGVITINNGGVLNNYLSDLTSGGGGRITVNSGGTLNADSRGEGVALDLQQSLLLNNGTVTGTTNIYYGATVQGTGTFGPINVLDGGMLALATIAAMQSTSVVVDQGEILGSGTLGAALTIDSAQVSVVNATDVMTLSGILTGTGALTKTGSGTLILSGSANTYDGAIAVLEGALIFSSPTSIADGASLTVGNAALFPAASVDPLPTSEYSTSRIAGATTPVPEPGTLALAVSAALLLCRWRRR
ncbi:MAG: autotransporter-associated beta strand repeat-containing protein [Thermoguttaceae bacterium]